MFTGSAATIPGVTGRCDCGREQDRTGGLGHCAASDAAELVPILRRIASIQHLRKYRFGVVPAAIGAARILVVQRSEDNVSRGRPEAVDESVPAVAGLRPKPVLVILADGSAMPKNGTARVSRDLIECEIELDGLADTTPSRPGGLAIPPLSRDPRRARRPPG